EELNSLHCSWETDAVVSTVLLKEKVDDFDLQDLERAANARRAWFVNDEFTKNLKNRLWYLRPELLTRCGFSYETSEDDGSLERSHLMTIANEFKRLYNLQSTKDFIIIDLKKYKDIGEACNAISTSWCTLNLFPNYGEFETSIQLDSRLAFCELKLEDFVNVLPGETDDYREYFESLYPDTLDILCNEEMDDRNVDELIYITNSKRALPTSDFRYKEKLWYIRRALLSYYNKTPKNRWNKKKPNNSG
ncbi:9042_t:CDS:2, partial [Paraglomus occultum]